MGSRNLSYLPATLNKVFCHSTSLSTSLSFLYQTRTIQSFRLTSHRCISKSSKRPNPASRHVSTRDPIPFLDEGSDPGDHKASSSQSLKNTNLPHRDSTITANEKAVFDRIFREMAESNSQRSATEETSFTSNFELTTPSSQAESYELLNSIFDNAIKAVRSSEEQHANRMLEEEADHVPARSYPTALRPYYYSGKPKHLDMEALRAGEDHKAVQETIQKTIEEHQSKVLKMFEEAKTDAEIWTILETEVFSLIERYIAKKRGEEATQELAKKSKRKRGRPSKAATAAQASLPPPLAQTVKAEITADEATLQALLSSNYATYCLAALRQLRRYFPTSPYTMNLMPAVKRLGPISHVLAASTDLYNELLFIKWKEFGDLHGVVDLMEEMGNQGIESDEVTLEVIKLVRRQRRKAEEEKGRTLKLWWELTPVKEAWARLSELAGRAEAEVMAAQVKRATEARELEEALEQKRQDKREEAEETLGQEGQAVDGGTTREVTLGDKLFNSPSFQDAKM